MPERVFEQVVRTDLLTAAAVAGVALRGLSNRPVAPHEGIIFTPKPAGESVRGGWLPELSQVVRSVGGMGATVGSAVRRWLG